MQIISSIFPGEVITFQFGKLLDRVKSNLTF